MNFVAPTRRASYFQGWTNVFIAAFAMVATLPGRTQGLGLITEPLLHDLGLDSVRFGVQNLWATLIGSTYTLACGPLIDRVGCRAVLTATLLALGATVIAMSGIHTPSGLLVTLTLTRGFGQSALSVVSLALVGKWFSRKLPLAMGVYALITGFGFVAAFPLVGFAVIHAGWRSVWLAIGLTLIVAAFAALLLSRSTPESVGQTVDGMGTTQAGDGAAESLSVGLTLRQALLTPAFWAYALAASVFGLVSSGLMLFNEDVLREHGFDNRVAIIVIAIVVFTGMAANFGGGWLGQRQPVGRLMAAAMVLLALSLICLPLARTLPLVYLYAVLMGIASGIVTVTFFVCWGKTFGRRHLGAVQGAAQGLTVLGSAAGPLLLAQCKARFHTSAPLDYTLAAVVAVLAIACALAPVPRLSRFN